MSNIWIAPYVWGGLVTYKTGIEAFFETVKVCLNYGFKTIRFSVSPTTAAGYGLTPPTGSNRNLAYLTAQMLANPIWDDPRIERVMVTAHDFSLYLAAGATNEGYLTPSIIDANRAAAKAEYTALFNVLKNRFAGRAVQFVISNWEGDNMTTGGAYSYATSPSFAAARQAEWGGRTLAQRADGMLYWWALKDQAVAEFKAANPTVNIIHAPEFNVGPMFDNSPTATVDEALYRRVALAGGREYASYSSYDAQPFQVRSENGTVSFLRMLKRITDAGIAKLIVGETGYNLKAVGYKLAREIWDTHIQETIPYGDRTGAVIGIVPWNACSIEGNPEDFSMFNRDGTPHLVEFMGSLIPERKRV